MLNMFIEVLEADITKFNKRSAIRPQLIAYIARFHIPNNLDWAG